MFDFLKKGESETPIKDSKLEKLRLDEQLLAQKRLIADAQKELKGLDAQKESILSQKREAEIILGKDTELKKVIAEKDAKVRSNEAELLNRIKAFEREQALRLREIEKRIASEERDGQDRLKQLEKEYAAAELKRAKLEKTVSSQHELLASLESRRRDAETRLNEKYTNMDLAKKELIAVKAGLKDFEDMQLELEKKKSAFEKQEKSWEKQLEIAWQKLRQKDVDLLQRERVLASTASSVASRERQLAAIHAEFTKLEQQKQEALVVLKQRSVYETEMRRLAIENEKKLSEIHDEMQKLLMAREDIIKKEFVLKEKEKVWLSRQKEQEFFVAKEMDKQQALLEKEKSLLEKKRRDVEGKLQRKEQLENSLNAARDELLAQRSVVENDVTKMQESLALIKKEREDKLHDLRSEFMIMRKEKQKIQALVDKDVDVLKDKESEIMGMLEDLEKGRQSLEAEENSIVKKVQLLEREKKQHDIIDNKLTGREKTVSTKEKELEKEWQHLARLIQRQSDLKAVEKDVQELEKQRDELEAWMKRVSAELLIEPIVERDKLVKEDSSVVSKSTEHPKHALQQIARLQAKKERGLAETREVDAEVKKIIQKKVPALLRREGPARLNILLTTAKGKISNGQLGEAKILIREAEMLLGKVKDIELRRNYGYDLKELKTNMKLAILA